MEDEEEEEEEGQLDPSDSDTPNESYPQEEELGEALDEMTGDFEGTENNSEEDHATEMRQERIVREEMGEEEDESSLLGGEGKVSIYSFACITMYCGEAACRVLLSKPCCCCVKNNSLSSSSRDRRKGSAQNRHAPSS